MVNYKDYMKVLMVYSKNKKIIKLNTWIRKGMVRGVANVDSKNRVFKFYNLSSKMFAYYSLDIVKGIEEVNN